MQRIAAHNIVYDGRTYRMHVIQLDADGHVSLFPLTAEIHSTTFISGTIHVSLTPSGLNITQ